MFMTNLKGGMEGNTARNDRSGTRKGGESQPGGEGSRAPLNSTESATRQRTARVL